MTGPGAPEGAVVITDRGISTKDNPQWLSNTAYRYLVISRTMTRVFDANETRAIATVSRDRVTVRGDFVTYEEHQQCRMSQKGMVRVFPGEIAPHPA